MSDDESYEAVTTEQRRTLWIVLGLNILLVVVMGGAGLASDSSALIANALDNASDAAVYALSLFAVGRSLHWKQFMFPREIFIMQALAILMLRAFFWENHFLQL